MSFVLSISFFRAFQVTFAKTVGLLDLIHRLRGPPSPSTEKAFTFAVPCQGCHRHPALARPRARGRLFVRGPLPGMPPASRAYAPPITGKAFRLRSSSQFFQRLLRDKKRSTFARAYFFILLSAADFPQHIHMRVDNFVDNLPFQMLTLTLSRTSRKLGRERLPPFFFGFFMRFTTP
jgi:hypothetical protein